MLLRDDPITQLAFSIHENKGVYALLLGSGLSRAAEIATGWEITLDLVRRIGAACDVGEQADWASWYKAETGQEPNYSTLLQELASSPAERRSILHGYIEPSKEDRGEGRKIPTRAHRAIAELVRGGYIRVLITTNFDRLLENALREIGVEPTVISSVDSLAGAEPITHSTCYILKLHGDYKDARILNTEAELNGYPAQYDALLDRIFDEHGLIVCGWSGEWDHALRGAFLRAPSRRYSTFWAARGVLASMARELVDHRRARVVPISDADSFFSTLLQRVQTLEQSRRQNPKGVELLVNSTKRFLSKPEYRIQLSELFATETESVIAQLDSADFSPSGPWSQGEFRSRVLKYEAISEPLASMVGVLGRWGDSTELPLVLDIIKSLYSDAEKIGGGLVIYLNIRSYPAVLIFTAYALGLVRAERWSTLHELFDATLDQRDRGRVRIVDILMPSAWKGTEQDAWKQIEGLEQRRTPLSDHLLALSSEWSKRFLGLTPDLELLFERFEIVGSLAHLERFERSEVEAELKASHGIAWMPVGRSIWHTVNAEKLIAELQTEPTRSAIFRAGFARNDPGFLELFIQNWRNFASRMRW